MDGRGVTTRRGAGARMWRAIAMVGAVAMAWSWTSPAAATTYRDADNGFTVILPDGWEALSDEDVAAINARQPAGTEPFTAAFGLVDRASRDDFPQVRLQIGRYDRGGVDRGRIPRHAMPIVIRGMMQSMEQLGATLRPASRADGDSRDFDGLVAFNPEALRFTMSADHPRPELGLVRRHLTGTFGREALIIAQGYAMADTWDEHEPALRVMVASVQLEGMHAYELTGGTSAAAQRLAALMAPSGPEGHADSSDVAGVGAGAGANSVPLDRRGGRADVAGRAPDATEAGISNLAMIAIGVVGLAGILVGVAFQMRVLLAPAVPAPPPPPAPPGPAPPGDGPTRVG